jgi:enamine deaminase RidA (YjgF/YER057c/UK114 family)
MNDLQAMNAAYTSHFPSSLPARTVAEVAHLPGGALVQITVVAGR